MNLNSINQLEQGAADMENEMRSQRDKSKSELRRISNSIYLKETRFKFDPNYYQKINEKYENLNK